MSISKEDAYYNKLYKLYNNYSTDYLRGHFDAVFDILSQNHLCLQDKEHLYFIKGVVGDILLDRGFFNEKYTKI